MLNDWRNDLGLLALESRRSEQICYFKTATKPVSKRSPAGSALGPLLLLIYINDMPEIVHQVIKLYAEDPKPVSVIKTVEDCRLLQEDIGSLSHWTDDWKVRLHSDNSAR